MKYNPGKYLRLVEHLNDPVLQQYMKDEIVFINNALEKTSYDVIDLGAGYGRIIPWIAKKANRITAIELNEEMYAALVANQKEHDNVVCLKNDATEIARYLTLRTSASNLFLLCQNTLGVIEGNYRKMFGEIKEMSKTHRVEIIISIFNKEALRDYGTSLYGKLKEMVGTIDPEKTNHETGEFISRTGYYTKWWSEDEIDQVQKMLGASIVNTLIKREYSLYHLHVHP
jgi:SAM-dependent methyltransferase